MYNITKDEALSLLQKMRQIRQTAGEMISFLEHMMQLQEKTYLREVSYNPDAYLEDAGYEEFDRVHRSLYCDCPCGCEGSVHPVNRKSDVIEIVSKGNEAKGGEKQ